MKKKKIKVKYTLMFIVFLLLSCHNQGKRDSSDIHGTNETKIVYESKTQSLSQEDKQILKSFLDNQKGSKAIWRLYYFPKSNDFVASRQMYSAPAFSDIVGEWTFHKKESEWYFARSDGYAKKELKYEKIITKESTEFVPNR